MPFQGLDLRRCHIRSSVITGVESIPPAGGSERISTTSSGGHSMTSGEIDTCTFPDIGSGMNGVSAGSGSEVSVTSQATIIRLTPASTSGLISNGAIKHKNPAYAGLFLSLVNLRWE